MQIMACDACDPLKIHRQHGEEVVINIPLINMKQNFIKDNIELQCFHCSQSFLLGDVISSKTN